MSKKRYLLSFIIIFFIIILTIGCVDNTEKEEIILTVKFGDYTTDYSLNDLESIEDYTGTGRYIKTKLLKNLFC